jgi:hypothetical protein
MTGRHLSGVGKKRHIQPVGLDALDPTAAMRFLGSSFNLLRSKKPLAKRI